MRKQIILLLAGCILGGALAQAQSKYINEWIFDRDPAGLPLSAADNSGVDGASFATNAAVVTQTDGRGGMICDYEVEGVGNLYTDGAILRADVSNQTAGVRYLRYDFEYDLTSENNNSGTLLGLAFADSNSTNLAGVVMRYAPAVEPPEDGPVFEQVSDDMEQVGSVAVIAKVDLNPTNSTISVWYNLTGENSFGSETNANASSSITLSSLDQLEFRATGDLIPSTNDCVRIDNIRTAATWEEIISPLENLVDPPELAVSVSASEAIAAGGTDTATVTVFNSGGIASNVVTTMEHDGGPYLSIATNSTPADLSYASSLDNTFDVTVSTNAPDGVYTLTVQAFSDGGFASAPVSTEIFVGARLEYLTYDLNSTTGGVLPDEVEPGETFSINVTYKNTGGETVPTVRPMLLTNEYFTAVSGPLGFRARSLAPGSQASGTFDVDCSPSTPNGPVPINLVLTSSSGRVWTNEFFIDVVAAARLAVEDFSFNAVPGEITTGSVTVSNVGNRATSFVVSTDDRKPVTYTFEERIGSLQTFWSAEFETDTVFSSWQGSSTEAMPIGFTMVVYGVEYTTFSANLDGTITLGTDSGSKEATLNVFPLEEEVDEASVRFRKQNGRLVVAWNNNAEGTASGSEFQAWLNESGMIEYRYANTAGYEWMEAEVGLADDMFTQSMAYQPGAAEFGTIVMIPETWLTYSANYSIGANAATTDISFTADATGIESGITGTNSFTAYISYGEYSTSLVVNVVFEGETFSLDVPETFEFGGPAGFISSPAYLTITNSGTAELTYSITDAGMRSVSYAGYWSDYTWRHIPATAATSLSEADLATEIVEIGFPFKFYGKIYTSLSISTNGYVTLGENEIIAPYSLIETTASGETITVSFEEASLMFGTDSLVCYSTDAAQTEFTVNWLNMVLPETGELCSFEMVLRRDGSIKFNYQSLGEGWFAGAGSVLTAVNASSWNGHLFSLSNNVTSWTNEVVVTNTVAETNWIGNFSQIVETETYETNYVTAYVDSISRMAAEFIPGQSGNVIYYSPVSGTIPVGSTADITLRGDARGIPAGTNFVTELQFDSEGDSVSTEVTFSSTNPVLSTSASAAPAPAVQAAMWGSDSSLVSVTVNADGSRLLSWPNPDDQLGRTYIIQYTTDLSGEWIDIAEVQNVYSYLDDDELRKSEPVIFYRALVK